MKKRPPRKPSPHSIPTATELAGVFPSSSLRAILPHYQSPGGQVRDDLKHNLQHRSDGAGILKDILDKIPAGNASNNLTFSTASFDNEDQTFLRVDHTFNQKFSVFFRYIHEPFTRQFLSAFTEPRVFPV